MDKIDELLAENQRLHREIDSRDDLGVPRDYGELHAENERLRNRVPNECSGCELAERFNSLLEAAAAVVEELSLCTFADYEYTALIETIDNLRIAAGIPAPPADETHDPDPDGDRRPETDR